MDLHRIAQEQDPNFAALLRIYTDAFPPAERKSPARLRAMLLQRGYRFYTAGPTDAPLGLAILLEAQTAQIALLEYLAVDAGKRGQGLGRTLLQAVLDTLDLSTRPVLVEVESDRDPTLGQADRRRRKQFYRSAGAREIAHLGYRMPAVTDDVPPPMELLLFASPVPTPLPKIRLAAWLEAIYREAYGRSANDVGLNQMLQPLPPEVTLL